MDSFQQTRTVSRNLVHPRRTVWLPQIAQYRNKQRIWTHSQFKNLTPFERPVEYDKAKLYASSIGDKLRVIDDYQTHHRLREATSRKRAEELNERVFYWSLGQGAVIILISVLEVVIVRSFFADKRSVTGGY
uniref:GOLD domain-containing protein n=1 Tax=Steinernema glaseri TaxID=37863 RepID=A0A1I8AD41_9BILA